MGSPETAVPETAEASTVDKVVTELCSAYELSSSHGPYKHISGVSLDNDVYDPERDAFTALLTVSADKEGMHGDNWSDARHFEVTCADISAVAKAETPFRQVFENFAAKLGEKREAVQTVLKQEREAWYQAGLPVHRDVTLLRPLQFRRKP